MAIKSLKFGRQVSRSLRSLLIVVGISVVLLLMGISTARVHEGFKNIYEIEKMSYKNNRQ